MGHVSRRRSLGSSSGPIAMSSEPVEVHVSNMTGSSVVLVSVPCTASLRELKEKIESMEGTHRGQQKLLMAGAVRP